ncbi:hypothetical protein ES319_A12G049800v1 [Gossypium barbadense]|uniref:Secreted protein n=1 Tax=Gossypium barbadense TaxID=3634 RepID=A0A5J5T6K9_GOSBA|nr:hypothetical protein ES319_A12G049800v1 [Gossypium barbadense]
MVAISFCMCLILSLYSIHPPKNKPYNEKFGGFYSRIQVVFLLFSCSNHRSWRRGCGRATSELGVVLGVPTCVVDRVCVLRFG